MSEGQVLYDKVDISGMNEEELSGLHWWEAPLPLCWKTIRSSYGDPDDGGIVFWRFLRWIPRDIRVVFCADLRAVQEEDYRDFERR